MMALYLLSILMGAWCVFDGIHVLLKGKYFGPPQPGPWAKVVSPLGLDPFSLGVPFILLGLSWLLAVLALFTHQPWATALTTACALASLWYLPVGTLISVLVLILLWSNG